MSRKQLLLALLLTLGLMILYNLNGRAAGSVDIFPATLLPVSLLKYGDATLNEFEDLFQPQPPLWQASFVFGAMQQRGDDIVSSYPLGGPLLATPFYAVARLTGILDPTDWDSYRRTGKLTASLMVALSAAVVFLVLCQWLTWPQSLWLALAYGVGSGAFSTASQGMWQHGPGMLCLSVALWALLRLDRRLTPSHGLALLLGAALALAVWCRNVNVFAAGAISLYMLVHQRRVLIAYGLPLLVAAVWLLAYNDHTYGNLSGGYDAILDSAWHRSRHLLETGLFNHPVGQGLLDTWFSPSKGMLIYTPFAVVALASLWAPVSHRRLLLFLWLWIAVFSVALARNTLWWGGTSFGPRYFLEITALLVVLIGLAYPHLPRWGRYGLHTLIVVSMMIHTLGAFYAPCGWAETPALADFKPERHWEWRDSEIERCLMQGWQQGPLPANLK